MKNTVQWELTTDKVEVLQTIFNGDELADEERKIFFQLADELTDLAASLPELKDWIDVTLFCKNCGHEWKVKADDVWDLDFNSYETIIRDDEPMNCEKCGTEGNWKLD